MFAESKLDHLQSNCANSDCSVGRLIKLSTNTTFSNTIFVGIIQHSLSVAILFTVPVWTLENNLPGHNHGNINQTPSSFLPLNLTPSCFSLSLMHSVLMLPSDSWSAVAGSNQRNGPLGLLAPATTSMERTKHPIPPPLCHVSVWGTHPPQTQPSVSSMIG